ncbi:rCG29840 [Rattus norvegicus]|uniref:RCG29840 n=1 Tax=Rattus norvegicus TaxID=10116 RepID=A6IMD2_RAT|nr:rCG29840 [Rattus norvegicus]
MKHHWPQAKGTWVSPWTFYFIKAAELQGCLGSHDHEFRQQAQDLRFGVE